MELTNDAQTREIEELKQEIVTLRKEISHLAVECLRWQDIANKTFQQEHLQMEFSTPENQINSDFSEEKNPLKAENEMLKLIIDKMNVGVFITDNNGNPLFFNKGALQMHGIETEEEMMALYSRFDQEFELQNSEGTIIPVEDWPNSKSLRGEFVKDFEVRLIVRKNGITKDISISTVPVYNDLNELTLIVYNLTDLSEIEKVNEVLFLDKSKKTDLEQIINNEERLRVAIESAELGTWDFDIDTGVAIHSSRHDQIFGYSEPQNEWSYEISVKHILPEFHPVVREAVSRALETGYLSYEAKITWPDGSEHWIAPKGRVHYSNEGKPLRMAGIVEDITKQKKVEESLYYERQLFEGIFNNIPILITIYDPSLKNFRFNSEVKRVFGWNEEDAASGNFMEKVYPDPEYREEVIRFMQTLEAGWREFETTAKDGTKILCSWANILLNSGVQIGIGIDMRERKISEMQLRDSEQRLQGIFNNAAIGIVEIDIDTRFIYVNQRLCEILGYTQEQLLSKSVMELTAPEDREHSQELYDKLHRGELNILNYEKRYLKPDGSPLWVHVSVSAIRNSKGKHLKSIGTIKDITERKEAERALRESEERFRLLADNISQIAWITNGNGEPVWYNKKWFDYTGLTLEDVQAKGYRVALHPDYADQVLGTFHNSLKNGEPWESIYPMLGKDGNYRWFLTRALPIHDNNHHISLWFGTNTDITDQRKVEEALREGEQRLAAIFNNAAIGIVEVSNDNRFILVNDRICDILGYTREELLQKTITEITAEEDKELSRDYFQKLHTGELDILNYEKRYLKKDGTPLWVHVSVSVIRDEQGNHLKSIGTVEDISERKKAEEAKRLSEEKLKAIFENLTEGLITVDPEGETLEWNPAALALHGYKELDSKLKVLSKASDSFELTTLEDYFLPHDQWPVNLLKRGESFSDYPLYVKNKEQGWKKLISYSGKLIRDHKGKPFMGFLSLRDITEMKKAEEDLRRSREELKSITDNSPDVIARFDTQLRHTFINPYGEKVYGKTREEIIGKTNQDLEMPEQQVQFWKKHFEEVLATGQSRNIEFEFDSPTFGHQNFLSVFVPEKSEQGEISSILAITREITEIKRSEKKILESEEMFSTMFHAMPVGVSLSTANGELYNVNKAWLELTGISKMESVIGKTAMELGVITTPQIRRQILEEFSRNGNVRNVEVSFVAKNGVERVVYINIDQVQIWGQKFFLSAIEDVTEQKRIEMEIQQKNEELTRFIYTVSHDLKSPLVTIKSFSSFLKSDIESNDKEALDRDIMYIQNAADKMGKLLDELLELSRIGRKEVAKTEVPMHDIAQAAIDLVAGQINNRKVSIRFVGQPVMLYGHSQRLIQLYQNLIDNAVKFMGEQPDPLIEIGTLIERDKILLFVRDNGIGIDPRYHHKIFGLFEKLDSSSEGTGIGLALIKRIVEVHGGSIWFVSEGSGKGTTFYFTLEKTHVIKN